MAHTCMDHLPAEPAIGVAGTAKALNAHLAPKFCPLTRPCPLLTPSHIPVGKEINLFYLKHHKSCNSTCYSKLLNENNQPRQAKAVWTDGSDGWSFTNNCSVTLWVTQLGLLTFNNWVSPSTAHCWSQSIDQSINQGTAPKCFSVSKLCLRITEFTKTQKKESAPTWELKSVLLGEKKKNPALNKILCNTAWNSEEVHKIGYICSFASCQSSRLASNAVLRMTWFWSILSYEPDPATLTTDMIKNYQLY